MANNFTFKANVVKCAREVSGTFDIMNPFFESFSKIKYGGLYMTSVFDKAQYGYF